MGSRGDGGLYRGVIFCAVDSRCWLTVMFFMESVEELMVEY